MCLSVCGAVAISGSHGVSACLFKTATSGATCGAPAAARLAVGAWTRLGRESRIYIPRWWSSGKVPILEPREVDLEHPPVAQGAHRPEFLFLN
ncbi:hypothetical protein EVAR_7376_1 [Eumeta japonica]|uniref:Uncharacterized protein n=1 Tax=Eumeta variegata TaxID=151549 RepID=A0A4C1V9D5_EUMVA|nr:hypothetical protein EVAR_7376_1 [Eumeta japonica]